MYKDSPTEAVFLGIMITYFLKSLFSMSITSMDVSLQRPIIVTTSKYDRTVRVWNYLTGHCEYCKLF
jgi:WD40 repeat protein